MVTKNIPPFNILPFPTPAQVAERLRVETDTMRRQREESDRRYELQAEQDFRSIFATILATYNGTGKLDLACHVTSKRAAEKLAAHISASGWICSVVELYPDSAENMGYRFGVKILR